MKMNFKNIQQSSWHNKPHHALQNNWGPHNDFQRLLVTSLLSEIRGKIWNRPSVVVVQIGVVSLSPWIIFWIIFWTIFFRFRVFYQQIYASITWTYTCTWASTVLHSYHTSSWHLYMSTCNIHTWHTWVHTTFIHQHIHHYNSKYTIHKCIHTTYIHQNMHDYTQNSYISTIHTYIHT